MTANEWQQEVKRLHDFYATAKLPEPPVVLDRFMTLHDPAMFVETCFSALDKEENVGSVWMTGNFHRLQMLERYILEHSGS